MANISNSEDVLDVRDIIERVEELNATHDALYDAIGEAKGKDKKEAQAAYDAWVAEEGGEASERATLLTLLEELKGNGGDEQWQGDWYPITLIRDSYFQDYAEELANDIGAIDDRKGQAPWPLYCIDWERAARDLQMDYSSVDYDDVTYWYR